MGVFMKKRLVIITSILIGFLILNYIIGIIIYSCIFAGRIESKTYLMPRLDDYPTLEAERHMFESKNNELVGYLYSSEVVEEKGIVVFAHGYGGGGQIGYLDIFNCLTSNGYYVFAYDATGNDESEGNGIGGLPQGIIDLENAIKYAKTIDEVDDLPMMLMGFSWGAFSVSNVLNYYSDVEAVVAISGFNESMDMIECHSSRYIGALGKVILPFAKINETIKYGKYANTSAIEGFSNTDAKIMIVHSEDDKTVPIQYGYNEYYEKYSNDNRFIFKHYDDKGHADVYRSYTGAKFYNDFVNNLNHYASSEKLTEEEIIEYVEDFMNREKLCNMLDKKLMNEIVALFDSCL